jgi:Protein of unknown function (DUF3025)
MTVVMAGAPETHGFARIDRIDWSAPWFAPFAERGARWQRVVLERPADYLPELQRDGLESGHTTGRGAPLTFIAQADLPAGTAYEAHIGATGGVPTRENLHDFFNALVWFSYPRVKATLNARQAGAIERHGIAGSRGTERDALTLFDENAVVFVTADAGLSRALVEFDWRRLFVADRAAWGVCCAVRPFGHALLEKLIEPYKACTAHAWIVDAPADYFGWPAARQTAWLDETIAASIADAALDSRMFAPLPVLGIPGWWPANADPAFYDDERVFRRGRRLSLR